MSFSWYGSMSILCFSIFREFWSVLSRRICLMSSSVEMHAKRALRSSFLLASTVCRSLTDFLSLFLVCVVYIFGPISDLYFIFSPGERI